jgi:hypothetical protein
MKVVFIITKLTYYTYNNPNMILIIFRPFV